MAMPQTQPIRLSEEGASPSSPFDIITLGDGRTVEWHITMDERETMFKLELRYSKGVEMPGLASLAVGAGNAVQVEKTIYLPSVSEAQIKSDAREILDNPEVRSFLKSKVSEMFLASVDAFRARI